MTVTGRDGQAGAGRRQVLAGLAAAGVSIVVGARQGKAATEPPPFHGDRNDYVITRPPQPLPAGIELTTLEGGPARLESYRGGIVVLNWWATWCPPCVKEMPSLLRLQQAFKPQVLRVVAVSVDRAGANAVGPFAMQHGLDDLTLLLDPQMQSYGRVQLRGLPMTMILDREGRELGRLAGGAAWDSPEAMALFRYYIGSDAAPTRT